MTDIHDGGTAFPADDLSDIHGMSLRQYAAIKLRVPDSGTDWLDDMIRDARRMDYAGQALAGIMGNPDFKHCTTDEIVMTASHLADAMLAARSEDKP